MGLLVLGVGCSDDTVAMDAAVSDGGRDDGSVTDGAVADGAQDAAADTTAPLTCDGVDCSGHGTCVDGDDGPRCMCDAGYQPSGLRCVMEASGDGLFVRLPAEGEIAVTLHPSRAGAQLVSFGVPFPRDTLSDAANVRVLVEGAEVPSASEELGRWRSLDGDDTSVRAVLVHAELTLGEEPLAITVAYGAPPTESVDLPADVTAGWVTTDEYAMPAVREPAVFAALSAEWLGQCLLRTRTAPVGDIPWWDEAMEQFSETAVNVVDDRVTADNRIDYEGPAAPWLFDRPMTLFNTYVRTGDVRWLRYAHRAAQYYAAHISDAGYFDLKRDDLKYSYGEAMWLDVMFTGDRSLVSKIEAVASAGVRWNPVYEAGTNFWTERHQTYALLAALSAWEATGDEAHRTRVRAIFDASYAHLTTPPVGMAADGCLLHTERSHEGTSNDAPICSPWMTALLGDAIWRYYLHS